VGDVGWTEVTGAVEADVAGDVVTEVVAGDVVTEVLGGDVVADVVGVVGPAVIAG
jgi:hypothetical protein